VPASTLTMARKNTSLLLDEEEELALEKPEVGKEPHRSIFEQNCVGSSNRNQRVLVIEWKTFYKKQKQLKQQHLLVYQPQ
jgi:cell division protein FtsL